MKLSPSPPPPSAHPDGWPAVRRLLQGAGFPDPLPERLDTPAVQAQWAPALDLLAPLAARSPDLTGAREWTLPYASLLTELLQRWATLAAPVMAQRARERQLVTHLHAPQGTRRELTQSQRLLPLPATQAQLQRTDALTILEETGYLPAGSMKHLTLSLLQRGMADWQHPGVVGAEPRLLTSWQETVLWIETAEAVPHFAELSFPGSRSAVSADDHRTSLLSGRLKPPDRDPRWVVEVRLPGQWVIERAAFHAFLAGLPADLVALSAPPAPRWLAWIRRHFRGAG